MADEKVAEEAIEKTAIGLVMANDPEGNGDSVTNMSSAAVNEESSLTAGVYAGMVAPYVFAGMLAAAGYILYRRRKLESE